MVNDRTMMLAAIAGLVVVGLSASGANIPFLSGATGPDQGPDAVGGDDDNVASLYVKANDALASNQPSYANVSYEVIDTGDGLTVAEGTTDTSSGFSQITNLDENTDYRVVMYDDDGSGDDYYLSERTISTNEGVKRAVLDLDKEGSATTEVFETSGAQDDDDTLVVSQGATETFDVEVTENTQNAIFQQPALVVKTNDTSAIEEVEVSGSSAESVPDRLSSYDDLFDTGTSEIVDFESETYTVQVTRAEDDGSSATVDVAVVDRASFKNDQGEWEMGYEDSDENDVGAGDANVAQITVN